MVGRILLLVLPLLAQDAMVAAGAQTLIENARGYAWEGEALRRFESLLIDAEGRVAALDPGLVGRAERIDAGGTTLLPGLIDAHGHVLALGRAQTQIDLSGAESLQEALARVGRYAAAHPERTWLIGRGWNQELWQPAEYPAAADLDQVVADRPVWLERVDGHAGWANSTAMRLAGLDATTAAPPDGLILRDADGRPSGIFVDAAQALIERVHPAPSREEDRRALADALANLASLGLTSVHDAGVDRRTLELYRELEERGELPLRVYLMLDPAAADAIGPPPAPRGERLFIGAVKLYVDGALGSRGAALLSTYRDADHAGLLMYEREALTALIRRYADLGYQVAVHAIGDRGNRVTLDAFETVLGPQPAHLPHRIEHAQVVAPADIPRFAALGLIASMQPIHATSDMLMAEKRLSREQLRGAYAWRWFLQAGVPIAAGSDFPVEPADPMLGLHAAVTRSDRDGIPAGGWRADQAMTVTEALRAYTRDAARAAGLADRQGSLQPGGWADFVLLEDDPFATPAGGLWRIQVRETWIGGQRVDRRPAGGATR